jgi:hypothetical protein
MTDVVNEMTKPFRMSETEQNIRYGIGAAAAATAIFAPPGYKWKGVLTAVAAETILSAIYGISPRQAIAARVSPSLAKRAKPGQGNTRAGNGCPCFARRRSPLLKR